MKLPIVVRCDWVLDLVSKINGFRVTGIEFIPFVSIVRKNTRQVIINHEAIHFWQMMETLIVGFYLIYLGHYLWLRRKYNHQQAYWRICLEREAYDNDGNLNYIKTRKAFAWLRKGK